jgi:hypothetical protein
MAYNDQRSYLSTSSLAAQNGTFTASGAIAAGTSVATFWNSEPTYICSIASYVASAASSFPAGVVPYVVVGTTTTTGQVTQGATGFILQTSSKAAYCTFIPPVALAAATPFTVGLVGTGTASATQTFSAVQQIVGIAPQYV